MERALAHALSRIPSEGPLVVLFSGGVDSGLLAWEIRERNDLRLSTFGVTSKGDREWARTAAGLLRLPFSESTATPAEVAAMRDRVDEWEGPLSPTDLAVEVSFALAVSKSPPGTLLCGQGADELFFGYDHYRRLTPVAAAARADRDLRNLLEHAWPRSERTARRLGRTLRAPYLDPEFVAAVRAIPTAYRFDPGMPKSFFRRWARERGLPEAIAGRPKKALQYGSGVDRLLKKGAASR